MFLSVNHSSRQALRNAWKPLQALLAHVVVGLFRGQWHADPGAGELPRPQATRLACFGVLALAGLFSASPLRGQVSLPMRDAQGVKTGVTFQWEDTQSATSDPATLQSITIVGKEFSKFAVPSGYELTQPGLNPGDNSIQQNGASIYNLQTDGLAGWDAAALQAFQSLNLNFYFTSNSNGEATCGNHEAVAVTTAVQHTLLYDPPLPVNAGGFAAVTERNANNCYHLAVFGLPPGAAGGSPEVLLGETFVRPWAGQSGPQSPPMPPGSGQDYWLTERVNENNGTIGIAIFKLDEMAPTGSQIFRVRLTASTTDPGDGKFLVMQSYAVAEAETMFIEDPPLTGDAGKSDSVPEGASYSLVSSPTHGELTLDPSGSYVYTPEAGFVGVDSFRYRVCLPAPNDTVCDEADVVITVRPLARNDTATGVSGQPLIVPVLANDPPFLGLGGVKLLNAANQEVTSLSVSGEGSWSVNGGTQLVFVPSNGFAGTSTPVRYLAVHTDSGLQTNAASVSVTYPKKASVGNWVWMDENANGRQDAGETGRNGVTVRLLDSGGSVVATTTTANDPVTAEPGYYRFEGLNPGTYSVWFTAPGGFVFSPRSGGVTVIDNSDADPTTGRTFSFSLANGSAARYVDAGLVRVVQNGALQLTQSAEWHVPEQNIARIQLSISATMPLVTRDVVLVLDTSGSMNNNVSGTGKSRITLMKEAAAEFATQFLDAKFQGRHRLAVVSFSSDAVVRLGLTSDLSQALNTLDNLSHSGGTNTQGGIMFGTQVLDSAPDHPGGLGQAQEKMMLVLADGQAKNSYNVLSTASVIQEDRDAFYFPSTYPDGSGISIKATSFGTTGQKPNDKEASWRAVSQALLAKRKGYSLYGVAFGSESDIGSLATWTMRHVSSRSSQYFNTVDNPGNIFNRILQDILTVGRNAVVEAVMGFGAGYHWQLLTGQPAYPIQSSPAATITLGNQSHSGTLVGVLNWTLGELRSGNYSLTFFARLQASQLLPGVGTNSLPLPVNHTAKLNFTRLDGQAQNVGFPLPALSVPLRSVQMVKTDHLDVPISGAGFTLYADQAGTNLVASEQVISGTQGATLFAGLVRGHTYFMRETTVPDGFLDEGNPYRLVVTDHPSPALSRFNPLTQAFEPLGTDDLGRWQVVNRPPATAVEDSSLDNRPGETVQIDILANDLEGGYPIDAASVVLVNPPSGATLSPDGKSLQVPGQGTWTVNDGDGSLTLTPVPDFWGEATPVYYRVSDERGFPSNEAPVSVSFRPFLGIGNLVFVDGNDNGRYDPGEGAGGVPVELYTPDQIPGVDIPVGETVTTADGHYYFGTLASGPYFVHIPARAFYPGAPLEGYSAIALGLSGDDDVGQNGIKAGDPEMEGVSSGLVSLALGSAPTAQTGETGYRSADDDETDAAVDLTIDFGFQRVLGVGNLVYVDANDNGVFDDGEGVAGVRVELYRADQTPGAEPPILVEHSDADGVYLFDQLAPGSYRLFIPPVEFAFGRPLWRLRSLPGTQEGDDDQGEKGMDEAQPDINGIVTAVFTLGRGTMPVDSGTETGGFNHIDNRNDGDYDLTRDFGFAAPDPNEVGVGNLVFVDANGNGRADEGEGRGGVLIELFTATDDPQNATPLAQMTTSGEGVYLFAGLSEGAYLVHIPATQFQAGGPLEGLLSVPGAGGDWGLDDDFDENGVDSEEPWVTGISSTPFYLAPGSEPINSWGESGHEAAMDDADDDNTDLTIDLGFSVPMGLGNLVFNDLNGNGRADAGEGVAGVTVRLFEAGADPAFSSPVAETETDAQGRYLMEGISSGQYFAHIPHSMFAPGAPLHGLVSLAGTQAGDDDVGEKGVDNDTPEFFGISSQWVVLQPGQAPVGAAESGFDGASDDERDANVDLTVDFGFGLPASVGDLVFHDVNGDGLRQAHGADGIPGTADDEAGLGGVRVELWLPGADGAIGGGDDALAREEVVTGPEGGFVFNRLSPGRYYLVVPAVNFEAGGALESLPVASPVRSASDDGVDDDNNGVQPGGRATAVSSPLITLGPGENDMTVDFGLLANLQPLSWLEWQMRHGALGDTSPGGNGDGDVHDNVAEFGFGLNPRSGLVARQPVRLVIDPVTQQVDVCVDRVTGIAGLSYELQVIADLLQSPQGWQSVTTIGPSLTHRADGTEEARYGAVSSLPGLAGRGQVRVKLSLDSDLNGEPEAVTYSKVLGWSQRVLGTHLQTLGQGHAIQGLLSARIDAVNGSALDLSGSLGGADVKDALVTGSHYYVEILEGAHAGHRLEVNESSSQLGSLVIDSADARSTLTPVPATLAGARLVLRRHVTLDELASKTLFRATTNASTADRVMLYDPAAGAFRSYWLLAYPGAPRWVLQGDASLSNRGGLVLEPGLGLYVQPRTWTVTLMLSGEVRDHAFACPLPAGVSLRSTGWPLDLSPAQLGMNEANGFTGASSASLADQMQIWRGDSTAGLQSYNGYYFLRASTLRQWVAQGDPKLSNLNEVALIKAHHSLFFRSRNSLPTWVQPCPWVP